MNPVYIVEAVRSPIGSFQGALSSLSSVQIGSQVLQGALSRISLNASNVSECVFGSVLTAGQGQAPARQLSIAAGLPSSVPAFTLNKVCSSGLYATILGARSIQLGFSDVVVTGGMESMSNVPYYLPSLRNGGRLGNVEAIDGIIKDGLWDVYNDYHMGVAGELCAETYKLSREMQDEYALESYRRAKESIASSAFKNEIVPIKIVNRKEEVFIHEDEEPGNLKEDKVKSLKAVFKKDGTITAANASSLNDGAAVLILCSEKALKKYNLKPLAKILSEGVHAQAPEWFTTAPVGALNNALTKVNLPTDSLDAIEINEAFSAVALACISELKLDPEKVNPRGGAVALGHPIGASGARILVTLLSYLKDTKGKKGGVAICNGGGEATAMIVEMC